MSWQFESPVLLLREVSITRQDPSQRLAVGQMDARPQKRNRTSSSHERPGESAPTPSSVGLKRSEEFWLQDGNLVLVAGNVAFRVYRGLLAAQSEVFEGLFASATPATGEMFQGCPVVHLSDSPEDLVRLLRVLLPMTNKACVMFTRTVEMTLQTLTHTCMTGTKVRTARLSSISSHQFV